MPELPEVQTTVNGINMRAKGVTITDFWTDLAKAEQTVPHFRNTIKDKKFIPTFKKGILGAKIIRAERRAKHILIHLSNKKIILIHMKMTGHIMYGKYIFDKKKNTWTPNPIQKNQSLLDPYNRFIHAVFILSNDHQLVFCDARKFGSVELFEEKDLEKKLQHLGPEPLEDSTTLEIFIKQLKKKPNVKIKQVLLDQSIISGLGNIYCDEMLFEAGVHPERLIKSISPTEYKKLFAAMKKVLEKGLKFGGDSTSDYRDIDGSHGTHQNKHNAYKQTGKKCNKKGCPGTIKRIVIATRSTHYCTEHQK